MDPDKLKAAIEALKNNDGDAALKILEDLLTGAPSEVPPDAGAEALGEGADPKVAQALSAFVLQLTGADTVGGAAEILRSLRTRVDALDANAVTLDASERRGLVGELVKLGAELPATAWTGEGKDRAPVKRLADEPLPELRSRVAQLRAAGPRLHLTPPATEVVTLSAHEQATADAIKDPAKKAKFIELRAARMRG